MFKNRMKFKKKGNSLHHFKRIIPKYNHPHATGKRSTVAPGRSQLLPVIHIAGEGVFQGRANPAGFPSCQDSRSSSRSVINYAFIPESYRRNALLPSLKYRLHPIRRKFSVRIQIFKSTTWTNPQPPFVYLPVCLRFSFPGGSRAD